MFYEQTILTSKKDGMGVVWLAATLGAKHSLKKIHKKDFLSVDVRKTCHYIAAPTEPLALRTSSSLMIGVSRVLAQQYGVTLLLTPAADASLVHNKIKQNLLSMSLDKRLDLDLPVSSRNKSSSLLLPDDPNFDIEMFAHTDFAQLGPGADLSDLSLTFGDGLSNLSVEREALFSSNSASVSLLEGNFTPGSYSITSRLPMGDLQIKGLLEQELEEDPVLQDNMGFLDFEFDANGDMVDISRDRTELTHRPSPGKRSVRSVNSDSVDSGQDAHILKRPKLSVNQILDVFPEEPPQIGLFDGLGDLSVNPLPMNQSTPWKASDGSELDFIADHLPNLDDIRTAARNAKRRSRVLVLDDTIEIASKVMKDWQTDYLGLMQRKKAKTISRAQKLVVEKNAELFVWGFRGEIRHPSVKNFFDQHLVRSPFGKQESNEASWRDTNDRLDPEIPGPVIELPMQDTAYEDVEVGRRADTEDRDMQSGHHSVLPWNVSREGSLNAPSGTVLPGARSASVQSTPRQFSFMQTPMIRSRQTSLRPGSLQSGAVGMGILERLDSQDMPAIETDHLELAAMAELAVDTQLADESQYILQNMQQESFNFLESA